MSADIRILLALQNADELEGCVLEGWEGREGRVSRRRGMRADEGAHRVRCSLVVSDGGRDGPGQSLVCPRKRSEI